MQIKSLPPEERPQEKMMYYGKGALSTAELIALLIRTGSREKSAVQLAEDIISFSAESSGDLYNVEPSELMSIDGVGKTKACAVVAAMELMRRSREEIGKSRDSACNPREVYHLLRETLRYEKREHLIELIINNRCQVESRLTISIGALDSTALNPREVLNPAIRRSAAGIILVHNHPSGSPDPSAEDIAGTARIKTAAELVGIRLLDHIIIAESGYFSMKEQGYLEDSGEE